MHQLGEHYLRSKIGEVLTPVGTIKMSVSYRSKDDMTITPQKVEKGSSFMMKSDYFKPDMSPHVPPGGIRIDRKWVLSFIITLVHKHTVINFGLV